MPQLQVIISDKIATYVERGGEIVCGNSDYSIKFSFDEEWAGVEAKTARFVWNSEYYDVDFEGDTCSIPVITKASQVQVGVYAGELQTTTPALIKCRSSILCQSDKPSAGNDGSYCNEAKAAAERSEAAATRAEEAAGSMVEITVDTEMSETSENPVQNKVITSAFHEFGEAVGKAIEGISVEIPTYDLTVLGLPTVPLDGTAVQLETDTTDIMAALDKGAIKVLAKFAFGATEITATVILNSVHIVGGEYICSYAFDAEGMTMIFNLVVGDGAMMAYYTDLSGGGASGLPEVTTEDEGKFLRVVNGAWSAVSLTDVSTEGA
jgi:hypothetical protein